VLRVHRDERGVRLDERVVHLDDRFAVWHPSVCRDFCFSLQGWSQVGRNEPSPDDVGDSDSSEVLWGVHAALPARLDSFEWGGDVLPLLLVCDSSRSAR
jgi:hypothetical protein